MGTGKRNQAGLIKGFNHKVLVIIPIFTRRPISKPMNFTFVLNQG